MHRGLLLQHHHFPASSPLVRGRIPSLLVRDRYGLGGPGIESRWGSEIFRIRPGTHSASYTAGTGSFPGVKRQGRGVDNPPPSSAEVKEKVDVPLWVFVAVLGRTFTVYVLPGTRYNRCCLLVLCCVPTLRRRPYSNVFGSGRCVLFELYF